MHYEEADEGGLLFLVCCISGVLPVLRGLRESFLLLGFQNGQELPVSFYNIQVVEPDSAITEVKGFGRPFAFISAVEKVFLEFFFGNMFRIFVVMDG
jgi:hypothetical protein